MRIDPQQQRVVVQHLLEMGDRPGRIDAVASEATGKLVVHSAAGHRLAGLPHHLKRLSVAGSRVVPEKELKNHGRWKLRRRSEAAVAWIKLGLQYPDSRSQLLGSGWLRARKRRHALSHLPNDIRAEPFDFAPLGTPCR